MTDEKEINFPNCGAQWNIDNHVAWVQQTRSAVIALSFMWDNNKVFDVINTAHRLAEANPEAYEEVVDYAYTFQEKVEDVSSAFWKVRDALMELAQFAKLYQNHTDSITSRLNHEAWEAKKRQEHKRLTEDFG